MAVQYQNGRHIQEEPINDRLMEYARKPKLETQLGQDTRHSTDLGMILEILDSDLRSR